MSLPRLREPVLVLGATSLVGRRLLPRLRELRAVTVAVSRRSHHTEAVDGIRWVRGDLSDPRLELPYAETALSLCPIWLLPQALPALRAAGVRRLLAFSSTSVATKSSSPEPEERRVAERLAEAEAALRVFCDRHDIGWTVLRPTLIYDEGQDANVSRLARIARRFGVVPLAGWGRGLRQPVHAQDLAWAALAAAAAAVTAGKIYELPGGETLTYRAMVERIFHGLDKAPRILSAPEPLWRLAFRLAGDRLPGATAAMGQRMNQDLAFDPGPAERDFGWAPRPFRPVFPDPEASAG